MGWVAGPHAWTRGGGAPSSAGGDIHAAHDHAAMMQAMPTPAQSASSVGLNDIVAKAMPDKLAFPVIVTPPGAPGQFGAPGGTAWTVRSDAQNRPLHISITYEIATGPETSPEDLAQGHLVVRIYCYGTAW